MKRRSIFDEKNGNGVQLRSTDFVAVFDHAKVAQNEPITLEEHVNNPNYKLFSMVDPTGNPVKIVGTEDPDMESYDYCVAFHDRRTRETEVRPVSLIRFEPKQNVTKEFLSGKVKRNRSDFMADKSTVNKDNWREKQNNLVMEFGNTKRRKILEAAQRRRVGDETLDSLGSSMINGDDMNVSIKEIGDGKQTLDLSMLTTPESMVLPPMNRDAKNPADVYSFEQFIKPEDLGFLAPLASGFFAEHDTVKKLTEKGIPEFAAKLVKPELDQDKKKTICGMRALCWSKIYKHITDSNSFTRLDLNNIALPNEFVIDFAAQFTEGQKGKQGVYKFNKILRNKLCAHLLTLLILFSPDYELPVGPLKGELGISEYDSNKLLAALGLTNATVEQMALHKSTKMARLVGVGATGMAMNGRRRSRR